jgi:hypothetical protein
MADEMPGEVDHVVAVVVPVEVVVPDHVVLDRSGSQTRRQRAVQAELITEQAKSAQFGAPMTMPGVR